MKVFEDLSEEFLISKNTLCQSQKSKYMTSSFKIYNKIEIRQHKLYLTFLISICILI